MQAAVKQFDAWHKTKIGYAVMAVVELGLAYVLASRAIDTGSIWQYLFAIVLLAGCIRNIVGLFHQGK